MTFNGPNYQNYLSISTPQWVDEVNAALQNPGVDIVVDLGTLDKDMKGSFTPIEIFMNAVTNGKNNGWKVGRGTEWEMYRIHYYAVVDSDGPRDWGGIRWFMNGNPVPKSQMPKPAG